MLAELSVLPVGAGANMNEKVAKAIEIIHRSGLSYQVTPMGTIIEGTWDQITAVAKQCHEALVKDVGRVITWLTLDERDDVRQNVRGSEGSAERRQGD